VSTTRLGEAPAHLKILGQAFAQAVQAFRDFLPGMTRQILRAEVDFDAGNDVRIADGPGKGSATILPLADGFVVQDGAADALGQASRGHDHLAISTPGLGGLGNSQLCEALVAGWVAFIHCQQALVVRD
jgi:hypothetical protein